MKKTVWLIIGTVTALIILILSWQLFFRKILAPGEDSYFEPFDSAGTWMVGDDATASGTVHDGIYEITVNQFGDIFWVTAGKDFSDGVFEVEARPVEGSIDNGYGIIFRVDEDDGAFYVFKVSSDGYAFIGRCNDFCLETQVFESKEWFSSPVIVQGLNVTNTLRVSAAGSEMAFYVNDIQIGQISDDALKRGDIGLIAETFAPGGVRIAFDNYTVTPIENK